VRGFLLPPGPRSIDRPVGKVHRPPVEVARIIPARRCPPDIFDGIVIANPAALVTGASGGIGREIARQLASAGFTVYVGSRTSERGQRAVDEIGERARLVVIDVTDETSIADAAAQVSDLDVLVNNAGVMIDGRAATEADVESFRRTYETNVFGVLAVTNAFLPALRRSAHPRVVNVSSGTGSLGWSTGPNPQFPYETGGTGAAYRSSKTALNALTVFYAQALAADGFKVNALAPGLRATNLNERAAASDGDPAEAAAGAVRLALLPDDGPTGQLFSWDGTVAPW
jgi:NAD(P)-dependent dehydrogenase (short-subunit alcohol dehydrogenase family)